MSKKADTTKKAPAEAVAKTGKLSTVTVILVAELVVMAALIIIMTIYIGNVTHQNALDHMETITAERAQIIESYVQDSEKTLRSFAKASQVKDLLMLSKTMDLHELVDEENRGYDSSAYQKYPEEMKILEAAQAYTEEFGKDVPNLEGFWIGSWETLVMTHTGGMPVVGMTTRQDPALLQQLQNAMLKGDNGLYNAGIIISPASKKQILSMYIDITDDNGEPIGLVGLGIFTDQLVDNLDRMEIKGLDNTTYSMVNVPDNKYIFNSEKELVTQEATNQQILDLTASPKMNGSFEYGTGSDRKVSTFSYIQKYNWIMMIDAPRSQVYAMTRRMLIFVVVFGFLIIGLILVFAFLNQRQEKINRRLSKQIQKTEKTKESLNAAMFKDVLTNAFNRVSLSIDLDEMQLKAAEDHPFYFVMFNILDFSAINSQYGNDAGDSVLVNVADALKEYFPTGKVYRTGSDEFVVAVEGTGSVQESQKQVMELAKEAHYKLINPMNVGTAVVTPTFKVSVGKRVRNLNTTVIAALKDMGNKQ